MTSENKHNEKTLLRRIEKVSEPFGANTNQRFVRIAVACLLLVLWRLTLSFKLGLGDDEGYYWDWSQHLAWSYFDHPPLVGWLIALSQALLPKAEWSVRLPFIALDILTCWMLFQLARSLGSSTPKLNALMVVALLPLYTLGGFMAFPDIPMLAAWVSALYVTLKIERDPSGLKNWLLLGLCCGFAVLSKLTGLILLASVGVWFIVTPRVRGELRKLGPWLGFLLTCVLMAPVIVWNVQNDFPTVRFQLWERHHGEIRFSRWLTFILVQLLVLSPYVWTSVFCELKHRGRWLLSFSVLPLVIFYLQPLRSDFLPHWTAPAYLAPLAAISWTWNRRFNWNLGYLFLVNILFLLICSLPVMPWLSKQAAVPGWRPAFDFSGDFYGWPEAGEDVGKEVLKMKTENGQPPLLLTSRYQIAGNLAFYSGFTTTAFGDRANAYRFFSNSLYKKSLTEQDALFVADNRYSNGPEQTGILSKCTLLKERSISRLGLLARTFSIWRCRMGEKLGSPDNAP